VGFSRPVTQRRTICRGLTVRRRPQADRKSRESVDPLEEPGIFSVAVLTAVMPPLVNNNSDDDKHDASQRAPEVAGTADDEVGREAEREQARKKPNPTVRIREQIVFSG
jgi:hypothetical protein